METIGMDVVRQLKSQYARVLKQGDWPYLKEVSEYYLRTAATLKTAHIRNNKKKLLLRNAQKRLYLGIGCELLRKSLYLHHGFCINKFQGSFAGKKSPVHKLTDLADSDIDPAETFTMRKLIDNLPIRVETNERRQIQRVWK